MIINCRKKPVVITAIQWTGDNATEILKFMKTGVTCNPKECILTISTLEGAMKANKGDYILRGVEGEFWPCKQSIFEKTYEIV